MITGNLRPERFSVRVLFFLPIALVAVLWLGPQSLAAAGGGSWTDRDGEPVTGKLAGFDFEDKLAIFEDEEGRQRSIGTEDLSAESRWRLLASPTFARSFPKDRWTSQQTRYLIAAVSGPVLFLLLSFYLCALILFKNGNPLRALAGWFGSAFLGGFLMSFYLVLSGRSPGSATGILILGAIISMVLLSIYVSVIYRTTMAEGLKLLVIHVFGAFLVFAIALITVGKFSQAFDFEPVIRKHIMIPVGLLPEESGN